MQARRWVSWFSSFEAHPTEVRCSKNRRRRARLAADRLALRRLRDRAGRGHQGLRRGV